MTSTWTDEERLSQDQRAHEQRLSRVNAAIAKRESERTEAARTNGDGWAMYSSQERAEREGAADQAAVALFEEELAEVRADLTKLEEAIRDVGAPLVGVDTAVLARDRELREAVRREVEHSTPAEIEQAAGAAVRAGDRQLGRIWAQEIAEHLQTAGLSAGDTARLLQLVSTLREQSEDPADAKRRKALERRRDAKQKHLQELNAAVSATWVEINKRALQASGAYHPL